MNTNNYKMHQSLKLKRETGLSYFDSGLLFFIPIFIIYLLYLFATNSPINNYLETNVSEIKSILIVMCFSYLLSDLLFKVFQLKIINNNLHSYLILPIEKNKLINNCILYNLGYYKNYLLTAFFIVFEFKIKLSFDIDLYFMVLITFMFICMSLLNSGIVYFLQNIVKRKIFKILSIILIYLTIFLFSFFNYHLFLSENISVVFSVVSILSLFGYFFLFKKAIQNFIYIESETVSNSFYIKVKSLNKLIFKLVFRSKYFLFNCTIPLIFLFFVLYLNNTPAKWEEVNLYSFILAVIVPRFYPMQKMFCSCSDFLITSQKRNFEKIISDYYLFISLYAFIEMILIFLFTKNINLSLNFTFSLIGVIMIFFILFHIYDPGKIDIFSNSFLLKNSNNNIKFLLLIIFSIIVMSVVYFFVSVYLDKNIFTAIIVFQGLTVFFTRKIWIKILNNVYMKNRYENLAKCRGEKFY